MILSEQIKITRVLNGVVAGTTSQNGTGLSMEGFRGIMFVAAVGALTSTQVTSLKAQQSSDDAATDDYTDIADSATSALADADGNKLLVIDIWQPSKNWVRPTVVRGTANAVIDGVFAIQYNARSIPTSMSASVKELVKLVGTAEGTA
ncbi:hypothetical protein SH661x_001075 [Planctomicrobium sp. SH661]|uniref:hypothetical protein n=1 Tax=Planctomicrobium sp. SH661 TaxID=3448124 RepID=UPI003F5C0C9B